MATAYPEHTVAYLKIALKAAEQRKWLEAKLNAEEGAKYAEIEHRLEQAPK